MRTSTLLLSALLLCSAAAKAQTVATFEDLTLAHPDTFYVNYTASGTDIGVNDGLAHFPCVYDTSYGGFWSYGFAYSNMTDSVTSGYGNQYAAKAGHGYDTSHNYMVAYGQENQIVLNGAAIGHPVMGFYLTNSTYAANSMRDGDMFARKFHNGDWFKLTVRGYRSGTLQPDSVTTYLADYLFPDTTMNYILTSWQWVNLLPLGSVDSLKFSLSSSDNGMFGMNTPAYFCLDNFTTAESSTLGVAPVQSAPVARVYPNPARGILHADVADPAIHTAVILDMSGKFVASYPVVLGRLDVSTTGFAPGAYILQLQGSGKVANVRFIKD